jgi:hypothetical protein
MGPVAFRQPKTACRRSTCDSSSARPPQCASCGQFGGLKERECIAIAHTVRRRSVNRQAGRRRLRHAARVKGPSGRTHNRFGSHQDLLPRHRAAPTIPPGSQTGTMQTSLARSAGASTSARVATGRKAVVPRAVETHAPVTTNGKAGRSKARDRRDAAPGALHSPERPRSTLTACSLTFRAPQPGVPEGTPVVSPLVRPRPLLRAPAAERTRGVQGQAACLWGVAESFGACNPGDRPGPAGQPQRPLPPVAASQPHPPCRRPTDDEGPVWRRKAAVGVGDAGSSQ